MKPIKTFKVCPNLPDNLKQLQILAYNLWWCWNKEAIDLWIRLNPDLWNSTYHNPVKMLGAMDQELLEQKSNDEGFINHLERVTKLFNDYMSEPKWFEKVYGIRKKPTVAYFSTEYGITESVPNYSGGLGVLSGDHLKSASDLGLPLVGVGLLYQKGYFRQYLNTDGWQGELYPVNDFYNMPVILQKDNKGAPILIDLDFPNRKIYAQIWQVKVGRINLYLLDTNINENAEVDQDITDELYGGDKKTRIKQEIMLGIGGIRALNALGIDPIIYHMNEGHSAFLALERVRVFMKNNKLRFNEAKEAIKASNIFTTHTPVPAGIDIFDEHLLKRYFFEFSQQLELSWDEFFELGKDPAYKEKIFSMAVLALNFASYTNGVSKLHATVSRNMWKYLWPNIPEDEIPIYSITNGIHSHYWISRELATLYERYLGPKWIKNPMDIPIWEKVENIPPEELWRTHELRRERLVTFARNRLKIQLENQGASAWEINEAANVLNPDALTIGFARRFATYKRAALLFKDLERLKKILLNKNKPVQIIFAGKAHPKDIPGKELIKQIIHVSRMAEFRNNVVFIEDYDLVVSRYLVQGADIWLNTPRRLREASGTSGMKAAMNGVINLSILDGWWDEAYKNEVGWAIGRRGEDYEDLDYQDEVEANNIYELFEKEIIPIFYTRTRTDIPRIWITRMKKCMENICPIFNTHRMVSDYTNLFYVKAANRFKYLLEMDMAGIKNLAYWKEKVKKYWDNIKIKNIYSDTLNDILVGSKIKVTAEVYLSELTPDDISVEVFFGKIDPTSGNIIEASILKLNLIDNFNNGIYKFETQLPCNFSGLQGLQIRIVPKHVDFANPHELGLIHWAK